MDLTKLNKTSQVNTKEVKKATELETGKEYFINHIRCFHTRFGVSAIADLQNCDFDIYLPGRVAIEVEPYVDEFSTGQYTLIYQGLVDTPNHGKLVSIKFNKLYM